MAKVVFFSPHSLIWVHAFPEAIVAESLMKSKHDIVYITCGEVLNSACICLTMMGVHPGSPDAKRTQVCQQCTSRADLIRKEMKLPGYSLASAAEPQDDEKVRTVMAGVSPANFSEFHIEGVPIGRLAAYEFLIKHKKMNADLSESEWQHYFPALKSAVKTFYILKRIIDKEKPDYAISYCSLYSVNAVFTYLARKKGVVSYFMQTGMNLSDRLQRLIIGRDTSLLFARELINKWAMIKDVPCNEGLLSEVTEHFLELLKGRSVFAYSASKSKVNIDVRQNFGILPEQKLLVATMSSYDELFAAEFVGELPKAEKLCFKTQADWIKVLVEWIKDRPEYFLIIRVHPREFPNKRESVKSQHADIIQKLFVDLPKNARVNWPEDDLSLYDLACEADVFLNAWSSVGQEMPLLGLPVVVYSREILLYPADLNYLGETKSEYFDQIERALKDYWSFERVRKSFRWYAVMFGRSQIRVDDSYAGPQVHENMVQRKFAGGMRRLFPLLQEQRDCQRRASDLKDAEVLNWMFTKEAITSFDIVNSDAGLVPTIDQETDYIKIEMLRLAKALWGGIDNVQEGRKGRLFAQFRNFLTH